MDQGKTLFAELPAALVDEVLAEASAAGERLLGTFTEFKEMRGKYRKTLLEGDLVINESTLGYPPLPTTCGTDGSYAIERLLTADFVAAAAVAVEGLSPPSEKRFWEQPYHSTFVATEVHHADTATVLRAVMLGRELLLSIKAPHDIVMLDGTLTLPIIYFNQALNQASETPDLLCSQEFQRCVAEYFEAFTTILQGSRSDKNYIALPKYSTRREIGKIMKWSTRHDDRGILTVLLQPGELTKPVPIEQPEQEWHLNISRLPFEQRQHAKDMAKNIVEGIHQVFVVHYKPHDWLPAMRIEMPRSVAQNRHRLATVIQGLKHQCATASMLEPYPVYLADRTVRALARSLPTFRQVASQYISEKYEGEIGEVFFAMHSYRSEIGG
jgi:hypothetical protein